MISGLKKHIVPGTCAVETAKICPRPYRIKSTFLWMSGVLVYLVALGKPNASTAFAIHSLE